MNDDLLWAFIQRARGSHGQRASLARVAEVLTEQSPENVRRFDRSLRQVLDRFPVSSPVVLEVLRDPRLRPAPEEGPSLLMAEACALTTAVLSGRAEFEAAEQYPSRLTRYETTLDGLALLDIAPEIYRRQVGKEIHRSMPGSVVDVMGYIHLHPASPYSPVYDMSDLEEHINADPEWRQWWSGAEPEPMEMFVYFEPIADVQVRRRRRSADQVLVVHAKVPFLPVQAAPDDYRRRASSDLQSIVRAVARRLSMPEPPPLPPDEA